MTRRASTVLSAALGGLLLATSSCSKVPLYAVQAGFDLADVTWFEGEETLFVFAEVSAEQGLDDPSVIEITYTTDEEFVDWTPIEDLPQVHLHEPVQCGAKRMCASSSVHVPLQPRDVQLRLRYHRDGSMALGSDTVFNIVQAGPAHSHRSAVVYGVFDEDNTRVQWRLRHQFPTIRNEHAEELGLRREFTIDQQRYGDSPDSSSDNPYLYEVGCDPGVTLFDTPPMSTTARAMFNPTELPLDASDDPVLCAESTVYDATGPITATAIARKNPEVRPAFPVLRSPNRDATHLDFFLAPCERTISPDHEAMQRQRLGLEDTPTTCIDDWDQPGFTQSLVQRSRDAVEAERANGQDMVLVIALHSDDIGTSSMLEDAIAQVAPNERLRNSPRLAGAFVLDSEPYIMTLPENLGTTLWCPTIDFGATWYEGPSDSLCAIAPDVATLDLGPFSFGSLPILPSRLQYLDFIYTFSEAQAGYTEELTFRVPEFSPTANHIGFGDIGAATFLDDEHVDAEADDAFSYCAADNGAIVVFTSNRMSRGALPFETCLGLGFPEDACEIAQFGMAPIDWLGDWHNVFGERSYELGIVWEFPYLMRMQYQASVAGAITAFGLSVPFGLSTPEEAFYGTELWTTDAIELGDILTQCDRFCDHPTFDSSGIYQVRNDFRFTYSQACYAPYFPALGDSGFPVDP